MMYIFTATVALVVMAVILNNQYYEIKEFLKEHVARHFRRAKFSKGDLLEEVRPAYIETWEEYELAQIEVLDVGREKYRILVIKHSDMTRTSHSFNSQNFWTRMGGTAAATNAADESVKFERIQESFKKIGRSHDGLLADADHFIRNIK